VVTASDYRSNKEYVSIYGGLLTENVIQALARVIVAEQMLEIADKWRVVTMTHDEVVCCRAEAEGGRVPRRHGAHHEHRAGLVRRIYRWAPKAASMPALFVNFLL
jgi:hypothetical protein